MPFNSPRHRAFKCLSHFNNSCFSASWNWKEKVFFSSTSVEVSDALKLSRKVLCAQKASSDSSGYKDQNQQFMYVSKLHLQWLEDELMSECESAGQGRCLGRTATVCVCVLYTRCAVRVLCSVLQCCS